MTTMVNKATRQWLIEQGAVRPMAATNTDVLVLGEYTGGGYPVQYCKGTDGLTRWFHDREELEEAPSKEDVLKWIKSVPT